MGFDIKLLDPKIKNNLKETELQQIMCFLCNDIMENPTQCSQCDENFCFDCIMLNNQKMSNLCKFHSNVDDNFQHFKNDGQTEEQLAIYNTLLIQCQVRCKQYFLVKDLNSHEDTCGLKKCKNYNNCQGYEKYIKNGKKFCSFPCYKNPQNIQNEKKTEKKYSVNLDFDKASKNFVKNKDHTISYNSTEQNTFENIFSKIGLIGGRHTIFVNIEDLNKKLYFKIGFTKNKEQVKEFQVFSDLQTGYAWFSKGQLRNNSNFSGKTFGPDLYKAKGPYKIKCIIDLQRGTIDFQFAGKSRQTYRKAFKNLDFKNDIVHFGLAIASTTTSIDLYFDNG